MNDHNELIIVPYVEINGQWSIADEGIKELWRLMERDGTAHTVFCEGGVKSAADLVRWCKLPSNLVHVVWQRERPVFLAWLNQMGKQHAFSHFCAFREIWGKQTVAAAQQSFDYWFNFQRPDGAPVLNILIGQLPEENRVAIKYVEKCGLTRVGVIPGIIEDVYQGRCLSAVFYYLTREAWSGQERRIER